jgi:predicted RNase H-like HicB family nuclease
MTRYALYLESGPQHKTTMAHVLDLLGCHVRRRTTEETVEAAPRAIHTWLQWFAARDEGFDADESVETYVETHITEGTWLGNGDPPSGFAPDFAPLAREEMDGHLRRLRLMNDAVLHHARDATPLDDSGRPLERILPHVAAAAAEYVRCSLDKPEPLKAALKELDRAGADLAEAMETVMRLSVERVASVTGEEMARETNRGSKTWTVLRTLRRMLEHTWEHLREIEERANG